MNFAWFICYWLISSKTTARIITGRTVLEQNNETPSQDDYAINCAELRARSSDAETTLCSFQRTKEVGSHGFRYDNAQDSLGNEHFRYEERFDNGTVIGEYGFTDYLNSALVTVTYVADENGFRPVVNIQHLDDSGSLGKN